MVSHFQKPKTVSAFEVSTKLMSEVENYYISLQKSVNIVYNLLCNRFTALLL